MHPTTFLERDAQIDTLRGYAREASAGAGRLVLVEGEAGAGKSTLLERLEAGLPDAAWHWGACDALFAPRPLAPFHDIAEGIGGDLLAACRGDAGREALFTGLVEAIRAHDGLTVLVVEDVHWADEATLDLLRHTGRRIQRERALLLVSFRDEGSGMAVPLRQTLGELARHRATRRVSLPPLTRAAVEQLVAGTAHDAARVHDLTGGNPFFVSEVLRGDGEHLPASARDAVLASAAPLDAEAADLLEAASLVGRSIDPALVQEVTGASSRAFDAVLDTGLVVTDRHTLRFRHEIARLAVADGVQEPRRTRLHQRILAGLRERGVEDDARLCFHAEGAGDAEAVMAHASAAGRRAAGLNAHREAAGFLGRALAADGGADLRARATLLDDLSTELGLVDDWDAAERHRAAALALWRTLGDQRHVGESLRMQARAFWRLARGAEARAAVDEALHVLEPGGSTPELARAVKDLAGTLMVAGEHHEALGVAERAAALAEELALPDVLGDALDTRACSLMSLGEDWEPTMRHALDVAVSAACHEQAGRAFTNYYAFLVEAGRVTDGERVFLQGSAYCEDHEVASFGNCLRATKVEALEATGHWVEASRLGWPLLETATLSPNNRMHFALSLVRIALRRGDAGPHGSIEPLLEQTVAACEGTLEPQWVVPARLLRAEHAWLTARPDDAGDAVTAAVAAASATGATRSLLGEAGVWARRLGLDHPPAPMVDEPWSSELRGDVAGAVRWWEARGFPYEAAMALAWSPECDHQLDGLRRLEAIGARAVAAVVRRRLRDAGVRSVPGAARASTREHPSGLTAREQEVLEELSRGLTNEEIAQRLVISVKTAGHHVSSVLAKLGVPGRREAVAEAVRLGLVEADPAALGLTPTTARH